MGTSEYRHCRPAALLDTVGGDRRTFILLVDIFRRDTAEKLGRMREALAQGDRAQLRFSTHAMKGTVGPTGADALLRHLAALEAACRDPLYSCGAEALEHIALQVELVGEELERFAAGMP